MYILLFRRSSLLVGGGPLRCYRRFIFGDDYKQMQQGADTGKEGGIHLP